MTLSILLSLCGCSDYGFFKGRDGKDSGNGTSSTDATSFETSTTDSETETMDLPGDDPLPEECTLDLPSEGTVPIDPLCGYAEVDDPWQIAVEWGFQADVKIQSAPMIGRLTDDDGDGDVDEDDSPDIVVTGWQYPDVYCIDATTGNLNWTAEPLGAGAYFSQGMSPTAAFVDLDGDGGQDVVMATQLGSFALSGKDGSEIWFNEDCLGMGATLSDLDADGSIELVTGHMICNAHTGDVIATAEEEEGYWSMPAVGDVDLDGMQEFAFVGSLYSHEGIELWEAFPKETDRFSGQSAILQADSDPEAEILMTVTHYGYPFEVTLGLFEHDGTPIWEIGPIGKTGSPCIADFDGDGEQEIVIPSDEVFMLELDGSEVWAIPTTDTTSSAGCSAFDLDGDGAAELIFAGTQELHLIDGATGTILAETAEHHAGATTYEIPVIADIDGDGASEIVISTGLQGVRAYSHPEDLWMGSGSEWRGYDFAIDNYPEDGSIPSTPPLYWQNDNLFRSRLGEPNSASWTDQADVSGIAEVCPAECSDSGAEVQVTAQAHNVGPLDLGELAVSLYRNDGGSLSLLDTTTIPATASSEAPEGMLWSITVGDLGSDGLVVIFDDDEAIEECDELNNVVALESPCG